MSKKKILILGGANLHCKLVKAAQEMGLYTIVTDYLVDSPAKMMADKSYMYDVKDIDGIVKMCRQENVDAVISTHLDPCQRPYYEICHRLGLPCYIDTWEQVFTLTDKDAFKASCLKNGVDIIPTYECEWLNDPEKVHLIEFPVLVKPAQSRGSRGQAVCYNAEEAKEAMLVAQRVSDNSKGIIEKYMGNKNDFTMTYIFSNGVPYMTKTSDRHLGALELGLEKVGIGTVSPSCYTDMYMKNVHPRIMTMLKDLNIKNGPVFMQGFVDGDTVRFYDPGYRFPGSEYDTMFERIWNIDLMKMMVHFALTGEMTDSYGELRPDLALLRGQAVITLWPTIRGGKISTVIGLEDIAAMPEVVCYTLRHSVGEDVPFSADVNQRYAEFDIIGKDKQDLKRAIKQVQETLQVLDSRGQQMIFGALDTDLIV